MFNEKRNCLVAPVKPLLYMERKLFSYKRELRALFADSAAQFGAIGTEEREEVKTGYEEHFE